MGLPLCVIVVIGVGCAQGERAAFSDGNPPPPDAPDQVARPDASDSTDATDARDAGLDASSQVCGAGTDGMECGMGDVCHAPPVCMLGRCTARPLPDGTVCAPAADACHTSGTCQAGSCGPQGFRPDGYNYSPGDINRCCGGVPVQTNTSQHCGVCGISCGTNACATVGGVWLCACSANSQCWSGCCATSAGPPSVCTPSTCGNPAFCLPCPGGAFCTMASPHFYCHY